MFKKTANIFLAKALLAFVLMALLNVSCKKEQLQIAVAEVRDTGSFADGGCEWILEFNSRLYQPHNLPDDYKINNLPVIIRYSVLRLTTDCPNGQNYAGVIHLNKIEDAL